MSKRSGPTSGFTKQIIIACEKAGRESKAKAWTRLCNELQKPTRIKRSMTVTQLDHLAKNNPKKIMVVMGKVLGKEPFTQKATVYAFAYSAGAKKSIEQTGEAKGMLELATEKPPVKEWVMVQ